MAKVKQVVPYIAGVGLLIVGACLVKKKISTKNVQLEKKEDGIKEISEEKRNYIKLR